MDESGGLEFPDAPRSELETTIEELVQRAQRVLETQGRLRSLLQANRAVVEELDVASLLRRIVEAAVALVDAQYGALGVIAPDGRLEQFIHVGIADALAKKIGHLPEGHGLLGAVIDQHEPILLDHLGEDSRSSGFPAYHPAMEGFLGVPIRVRDEVYGNLYLTNPLRGTFTVEDQELVTALAATAGIAIDNARLFDETRRRQKWSAALADVTSALLSGGTDDVLGIVADRVASVVDADLVCVIVPGPDEGTLRVETARGAGADRVRGRVYPAQGTLAGQAIASNAIASSEGDAASAQWQPGLGPTIALPLGSDGEVLGVLSISREKGGARFGTTEWEMAADFANQAGVAIELTRARADRQRLELVDERSRIARDLHDHVIQRLFGTGLSLQALAAAAPAPQRDVLALQVDAIDSAISEIRTAVFALSQQPSAPLSGLRHRVLDVLSESAPSLSSAPRLTFRGPVDLVVTGELVDDVVAVVRETLANVARHAGASNVEVDVSVDEVRVVVTVDDDGSGVDPAVTRSSGLANLEERARRRNGTFSLVGRDTGGARACWSAQLEEGQDE
ncbi:two-component system sensor histidine kinase [soil metagenome]